MLLARGATVGAPEAYSLPAGSDGGAAAPRSLLSLLLWPRVVLGARFAATYAQLRERAPRPDAIEVGAGATLVVDGDVTIEALSVAPAAALALARRAFRRARALRSLRVERGLAARARARRRERGGARARLRGRAPRDARARGTRRAST